MITVTPCFYKTIFGKLYDIVIMFLIHKFCYEHNIEHNRSKIRVLNPDIIG